MNLGQKDVRSLVGCSEVGVKGRPGDVFAVTARAVENRGSAVVSWVRSICRFSIVVPIEYVGQIEETNDQNLGSILKERYK
jgi:acetylglutamate kinase